jgi:hypothetical protein
MGAVKKKSDGKGGFTMKAALRPPPGFQILRTLGEVADYLSELEFETEKERMESNYALSKVNAAMRAIEALAISERALYDAQSDREIEDK